MRNKICLWLMIGLALVIFIAPAWAVPGQLQTKRERLAGQRENRDSSSSLFEKIQESFLRGDYVLVNRLSDQYFSKGERSRADEVLHLQALTLLQLKRFSEARQKLDKLAGMPASSELKIRALVSYGDSYFAEGNMITAFGSYQKTLHQNPACEELPYLLFQLTFLSEKLGRTHERVLFRNRLLKEFPKSPQARQMTGGTVGDQSPIAESSPGPMPSGIFYSVQAGSFADKKNASDLARQLNFRQYNAYVDSNGPGGLFRVRIGKSIAREDMRVLAERLKKEGFSVEVVV